MTSVHAGRAAQLSIPCDALEALTAASPPVKTPQVSIQGSFQGSLWSTNPMFGLIVRHHATTPPREARLPRLPLASPPPRRIEPLCRVGRATLVAFPAGAVAAGRPVRPGRAPLCRPQ